MNEFNLSEKRTALLEVAKRYEWNALSILMEVEKQDKEFIKRLKDIKCFGRVEFFKEIDKLAGDKLTDNTEEAN